MRSVGDPSVKVSDVEAAARRLNGVVHHTPLKRSRTLDDLLSGHIHLKLENLQRTGSYKIRGAYNKIALLSEDAKKRGVIAASAGNHAQGLAYAARQFAISCTIVMPETAPRTKIQATTSYGARVVLHGKSYDDAYAHARMLADTEGMTYVHAFDDPDVIAGQGTVALEIYEDLPTVTTVIVPIGGGGLISGVATYLKAKNPSIRIIGVQAKGAPSTALSLKHGMRTVVDEIYTLADGIAVKCPGALTFEIMRALVDTVWTVSEERIVEAMGILLEREKMLVEGAGAIALAGLLDHPEVAHAEEVALIVSGGNIDLSRLSTLFAAPYEKTPEEPLKLGES